VISIFIGILQSGRGRSGRRSYWTPFSSHVTGPENKLLLEKLGDDKAEQLNQATKKMAVSGSKSDTFGLSQLSVIKNPVFHNGTVIYSVTDRLKKFHGKITTLKTTLTETYSKMSEINHALQAESSPEKNIEYLNKKDSAVLGDLFVDDHSVPFELADVTPVPGLQVVVLDWKSAEIALDFSLPAIGADGAEQRPFLAHHALLQLLRIQSRCADA